MKLMYGLAWNPSSLRTRAHRLCRTGAVETVCVGISWREVDGTVTEHGLDAAQVGVVFVQVPHSDYLGSVVVVEECNRESAAGHCPGDSVEHGICRHAAVTES